MCSLVCFAGLWYCKHFGGILAWLVGYLLAVANIKNSGKRSRYCRSTNGLSQLVHQGGVWIVDVNGIQEWNLRVREWGRWEMGMIWY